MMSHTKTMTFEQIIKEFHKQYYNSKTSSFTNGIAAIGNKNNSEIIIYFISKREMNKFSVKEYKGYKVSCVYTGKIEVRV